MFKKVLCFVVAVIVAANIAGCSALAPKGEPAVIKVGDSEITLMTTTVKELLDKGFVYEEAQIAEVNVPKNTAVSELVHLKNEAAGTDITVMISNDSKTDDKKVEQCLIYSAYHTIFSQDRSKVYPFISINGNEITDKMDKEAVKKIMEGKKLVNDFDDELSFDDGICKYVFEFAEDGMASFVSVTYNLDIDYSK